VDGSQQQDARLQLDAVKETVFDQVQSQCWPRYHFADLADALYRHQIRYQRPGMAAGVRDREMSAPGRPPQITRRP
jgi:hypothetical protein